MILQLDRRSYTTDLITYTNGIKTCSPEFVEAASEIMATYTYSENNGIATDIGALKKNELVDCIAVNVACGYINEHSDQEVISVPHLINAINFGYALFKNLGERKWEHVYTPSFTVTKTYGSAGNYGTSHKSSKTWSKNVWGEQEEEDYYDLHGFYGPYSDQYEKKTVNNFAKDDLPKISSMTDAEFEAYMNGPSGFEQDKSTQLSLFGDSSSKGVEKASGLCFTEKEFEEIEAKHVFISDLNNRTVELEFPEVCSTVKARKNKGKITRTNIDYWLRNDYCPECYNAVFVSNSYLLYSYCTECKGLFNVPESDYDYLNSEHKRMMEGKISEIEFLESLPVEVEDLIYFIEDSTVDLPSDKKEDNNKENPFDVN